MKWNGWKHLLMWIAKKAISLRYDIKVEGLDKKKLKDRSGILFLPNHPAEMDPVIIQSILMKSFHPRPLVVEHFYYMSGMNTFMRLVDAFPIPHVETTANQWKVKRVERSFETVKEGLRKGENFLIYPSGHLKKEGYEAIGGNSFIHRLINECPDVTIVLLRTTGLWGSMFSRAITGEVPNFWERLLQGIKIVFKNGIFFTPRRKVTVECAIQPKDFPREGTRLEINKYLEGWYNTYKTDSGDIVIEEPRKLVSFKRGEEVYPEITYEGRQEKRKRKKIVIPSRVRKEVLQKLSSIAGIPAMKITEEQELASDLAMDSLDIAGVHTFLDEKFGARELSPSDLQTVYDVLAIAAGEKEGKGEEPVEQKDWKWPKEEDRPRIERPDGSTVQEAFFRNCQRMGDHVACGDDNTGVLSYNKLKLAALVLSQKFATLPGKYVGVMLPSSIGAYLSVLGLQLAGKVPVMLNWTVGLKTLEYATELLNLEVILSSHKFLSRVESLDIGDLDQKLKTLEDIKHSVTLKEKLKGLWLSKKKPSQLMKRLQLDFIRETDPAVILFTSGTETLPKAVPLSHSNILENQKAALSCINLKNTDIFYGVLPPFHSFGFNVTGILPLLCGMKVFFSPDPTDSSAMCRDICQKHLTIVCAAPTFLKNLLSIAEPKEMRSVRLFVSGAEKAPRDLFDKIRALGPHTQIIEGYGITECAPMVTICRMGRPLIGVGQPLPNIELFAINPETEEVLSRGEVGEVCIAGPNVFSGYLGTTTRKSPFIDIKGRRCYRSGDLGKIDADGHLILEGRLKRFVKIGGEMISMNALEDELHGIAIKHNWVDKEDQKLVFLAVGANEKSEKTQLVLFTIFDVSKDDVNVALRESGFGRIVKISDVQIMDEIPLTGTGKVHFRKLNELAEKGA